MKNRNRTIDRAIVDPRDWHMLIDTLRLKSADQADARVTTVAALRDPDHCRWLLDRLGPEMGSPTRRITASLLGKRLSFLLTGAPLYALSACDRGLTMIPDNCLIEYARDDRRWTSSLPLYDSTLWQWASVDRSSARETIVRTLFATLIAPLWQTLQQAGGVSSRILWENTAVRVYSLYERRMGTLESPGARRRRDDDFAFLLAAEADCFGLTFNPLARFLHPKTRLDDGTSIRFRRTCCLYFQSTCPAEYCQTCPLLKPVRIS